MERVNYSRERQPSRPHELDEVAGRQAREFKRSIHHADTEEGPLIAIADFGFGINEQLLYQDNPQSEIRNSTGGRLAAPGVTV